MITQAFRPQTSTPETITVFSYKYINVTIQHHPVIVPSAGGQPYSYHSQYHPGSFSPRGLGAVSAVLATVLSTDPAASEQTEDDTGPKVLATSIVISTEMYTLGRELREFYEAVLLNYMQTLDPTKVSAAEVLDLVNSIHAFRHAPLNLGFNTAQAGYVGPGPNTPGWSPGRFDPHRFDPHQDPSDRPQPYRAVGENEARPGPDVRYTTPEAVLSEKVSAALQEMSLWSIERLTAFTDKQALLDHPGIGQAGFMELVTYMTRNHLEKGTIFEISVDPDLQAEANPDSLDSASESAPDDTDRDLTTVLHRPVPRLPADTAEQPVTAAQAQWGVQDAPAETPAEAPRTQID